jgi:hypothetical protein
MDSNVYSTEPPVGLAALESVVEALAAQDLTRLTDAQAAARVLALRGLLERLEGQWLRELANVDGRGAAGAEDGIQAASTAGWLRGRLAVRDGGCSFPNCDRPLAWCEAHHLRHWLHGGPTDLANLALLCRTHHRAVHEGGWQIHRHPGRDLTAAPPHRRQARAA